MQDAKLSRTEDGDYLMITLGPDKKAGVMRRQSIPLQAIAGRAEMLGYTDAIDAAEAVSMMLRRREREQSQLGGEHVLTEAYLLIQHREEAREAEAIRAKTEGTRDDPRSPALRGALAARRAVLDLTGADRDSESVIAHCQRKAREQLGLPHPTKPPTSVRGAFTCSTEGSCEGEAKRYFNQDDRKKLQCLLDPEVQKLQFLRAKFCHGLTSNEDDPLEEDTQPEQPPTLADITARYKERQDHAA